MTITRTDLQTAFPEFSSTTAYPDAQVDFWINEAVNQISAARLGTSYDLACLLYVAHQLSLSAAVTNAVSGGSSATSVSLAPVSSKSVGSVSKSMDVGLTSFAGAGDWNATPYGVRFYGLLRRFAVGPYYQVSARAVAPWCGVRRWF